MQPVTRDDIIEVWDKICDLNEKQCKSMIKTFMDEQPALGIYLSARTEDEKDQPGTPCSIDIALACWKALTEAAGRPLKTVPPEEVERAEDANMAALGNLEDASEHEFMGFVQNTLENYNQRELIGFTLEVLMSGNEENPELAPDDIGLELLSVKTLIDCLDRHG